ncbi:MAG TPA: hypothetical protein VGJ75_05500 [Dongiaceae bacterium]
MTAAALARQSLAPETLPATQTRDEIIRRYRHAREISKRVNDGLLNALSWNMMLQHARRLGLARGRTFILDSMDAMAFVYDLAIYTAPAGRSRAIDRYSAQVQPESEEARTLEAMRNARFAICCVERRHETAGLLLRDMLRQDEFWLVDEGLERTMEEGATLATRVFTPDAFSITCGVMMPVTLAIMTEVFDEVVPRLKHHTIDQICNDRRFAEAVYRTAMADGAMEEIAFQPVPEPED